MRSVLAAGLLAAATAAGAAPAEAPKHKCPPGPELPGQTLMKDPSVRKRFDRELKEYKDCMNAYVDERNAVIKAHQDAANAAINEYNGVMKALIDAQAAQQGK